MSLFEKLNNKRSSLHEVKDDELDKIKKPTKKANKEVFDVTGKSQVRDAKKYASGEYPKIGGGDRMTSKSKGPGASTGGTKIPPATVGGKSKGTTPVNVNITKPIKQSEVSKKAKIFTKDINKANVKRQETVANRKYFRGRKAQRVSDASGVKPTGSISRGVYKPQFFGDVTPRSSYKSSPRGQRGYDFQKMKIDTRDQKRASDKLDRKLDKSLMKDGKYPKELQKAMKKDGITKPSQAIRRKAKETGDKLRAGDPKAKKQVFATMDSEFKKMSKPQQNKQLASIIKSQTARGRKFNPKTGNFEDPLGFEQQARKQKTSKKTFPGDRSGATKLAKADIETKNLIKKAGGSGDIGFKAPNRKAKVAKRTTRASESGLKDPFDQKTKFSQKKFDKGLKDVNKVANKKRRAQSQAFKDIASDKDGYGRISGGTGKPTFPKKSNFKIPEDPFGKGDTPGQIRVKGLETKAFKKTQPSDVKLPQSSANFDRIKKEYRANVAKTSSSTGRKITKLTGGYGPAGPPQKGTPKTSIVKVKDAKPKSGTYSMVGTGKKEVLSRKKFVQSILKSPEYVKAKESKPNPSKFINKDTGRTFNMADPADKEKYLRQYGKDKFINQKGFGGGSGGSGGGGKKIIGGAGGAGGGGGRFKGFASKAASKGKGFGKGLLKFAKNNKFATAAVVGAAGYYGYQAIKRKIDGPQLDPRKDFTKTGSIRYGSNAKSDADTKEKMKANKQKVGDKVRFSYSKGDPDRAKPVMTPSSYSKFKNKIYTVKDSSGKTIDVNKRIQNSAFTKQLTKASTKKNQSAKDFMRKYQKAAEFRGITT